MAAAVAVPLGCLGCGLVGGSWRPAGEQLVAGRGWGIGLREGFMLAGLAAGATAVVAGLGVSALSRRGGGVQTRGSSPAEPPLHPTAADVS